MAPGNKLRTNMQLNLYNLMTKVKSCAVLLLMPFRLGIGHASLPVKFMGRNINKLETF